MRDDLARIKAAVRLRERCVEAALTQQRNAGLTPHHQYARASFDGMEQIIRADERARVDADTEPNSCPQHQGNQQ